MKTKNKGEGLLGVLLNKGTLEKYRRVQGNMNLYSGSRGRKLYKLEDENIVSKFINGKRLGTWEHRAVLEGDKDFPWETLTGFCGTQPTVISPLESTIHPLNN